MALIVNGSAASWAAAMAAISNRPAAKNSMTSFEVMVALHCKVFRINYLSRMANRSARGRPRRQRCRGGGAGFEHLAAHPSICHSSKYKNLPPRKAMATAPQLVTSLASMNRDVSAWVDGVAKLTQPDHIHWCDGTPAEFQALEREWIAAQERLPLDPQSFPAGVLSRSDPSDVARVEHLTFVCTRSE